jgi:hypothetical protein
MVRKTLRMADAKKPPRRPIKVKGLTLAPTPTSTQIDQMLSQPLSGRYVEDYEVAKPRLSFSTGGTRKGKPRKAKGIINA